MNCSCTTTKAMEPPRPTTTQHEKLIQRIVEARLKIKNADDRFYHYMKVLYGEYCSSSGDCEKDIPIPYATVDLLFLEVEELHKSIDELYKTLEQLYVYENL